jgi:hypothetical protein
MEKVNRHLRTRGNAREMTKMTRRLDDGRADWSDGGVWSVQDGAMARWPLPARWTARQ